MIFDPLELIHIIGNDIIIVFKTGAVENRSDRRKRSVKNMIPVLPGRRDEEPFVVFDMLIGEVECF